MKRQACMDNHRKYRSERKGKDMYCKVTDIQKKKTTTTLIRDLIRKECRKLSMSEQLKYAIYEIFPKKHECLYIYIYIYINIYISTYLYYIYILHVLKSKYPENNIDFYQNVISWNNIFIKMLFHDIKSNILDTYQQKIKSFY